MKDRTYDEYRKTVAAFIRWVDGASLDVADDDALDWALVEYAEYSSVTRAEFGKLLTALRFFRTDLQSGLGAAYAAKAGWSNLVVVRHTVPMLRVFVYGCAQTFGMRGHSRLAAGLLVQFGAYLRPSELLGLTKRDVVLPEHHAHGTKRRCYVLLGMRGRTTKVRREQVAEVCGTLSIAALRWLCRNAASDDTRLVHETYDEYRKCLLAAAICMGIPQLGFTPHSPRAGAATQDIMDDVPFGAVQEYGRWAHAQSCRMYLDRAKALAVDSVAAGIRFSGLADNPSRIGAFFALR